MSKRLKTKYPGVFYREVNRIAVPGAAIDEDAHLQAGTNRKTTLFTGMRRGELFKLKWQDIDFERGFIHIRDLKGDPIRASP